MIGVSYENIRRLVRAYDEMERTLTGAEIVKETYGKEDKEHFPPIQELKDKMEELDAAIQLELDYLALHKTTSS